MQPSEVGVLTTDIGISRTATGAPTGKRFWGEVCPRSPASRRTALAYHSRVYVRPDCCKGHKLTTAANRRCRCPWCFGSHGITAAARAARCSWLIGPMDSRPVPACCRQEHPRAKLEVKPDSASRGQATGGFGRGRALTALWPALPPPAAAACCRRRLLLPSPAAAIACCCHRLLLPPAYERWLSTKLRTNSCCSSV